MAISGYEAYIARRNAWMRAPLVRRLFAPMWASKILAQAEEYANGVDVSHWQGFINWQKLFEKAAFAYIKATDSTFTDSFFAANATSSEKYGKPRGFFHFLRSYPSGVVQAKYLIATAKDKAGGLGELPVMMDTEVSLSLQTVKDFIFTIYGNTGYYPLIYCSKRTWEELVSGTKAEKAFAAVCPLMVASWDTLNPTLPYTWSSWEVHQTGSKGDGSLYGVSSKSIDLDRARVAWLNQYINPNPEDDVTLVEKIKTVKDAYPEASIQINVNLTEDTVTPPTPPAPPNPPQPPTPPPPTPKPANVYPFLITESPRANAFVETGVNKEDVPIMDIYEDSKGNRVQCAVGKACWEVVKKAVDSNGGVKFFKLYDVKGDKGEELFVKKDSGTVQV